VRRLSGIFPLHGLRKKIQKSKNGTQYQNLIFVFFVSQGSHWKFV